MHRAREQSELQSGQQIDRKGNDMSNEEIYLLEKLSAGELDGLVGEILYTSGGSSVFTRIENGIPRRWKVGPETWFFNGKENERIPGVEHLRESWETPERQLEFFQRFGWLLEDETARAYSKKYK